jgi:peptidoglycan/xylan/chitin deacetylase (PgdA/CDA1 family)
VFDLTLSFDNGPEPEVTPGVLDILARRGINATFFVIGEKIADPARRALAQRASVEGHWIGNHTYSHSIPLGHQPNAALADAEISRTQALLGDLGARRLFRPFGGGGRLDESLLRPSVVDHLMKGHYTCVLWNAVPRDWADPDGWVEGALEQCRAQSWTLMVLHDLPTGAMTHLERFLDGAQAAGARFRQEFPPTCVPIRDGRLLLPIDSYVSSLH